MLSLLQSKSDLLPGKLLLHGIIPPLLFHYYARKLTYLLDQFSGRRSTVREQTQFKGETRRRHLGLPVLHVKPYRR
jgi:hypothetical protein